MKCVCCSSELHCFTYRSLLRCQKCNHVAANISLSEEEMKELYKGSYFSGDEYSDYVLDRPVLEKNFRSRISDINKFVPLDGKAILEVGCAYGYFLNLVKPLAGSVFGIDVSKDAVDCARKLLGECVVSGNFETHDFGNSLFDVVCMWDTIEHLRNPDDFIKRISKLLRPGGWLFLTTGDISSFNARLKGEKWRLIHPPTHLHYFGVQSMGILLKSNGLEVRGIRHPGFYRSFGNTIVNLTRRSKFERIGARFSGLSSSFYLNLYDIMFVAAQKPFSKHYM